MSKSPAKFVRRILGSRSKFPINGDAFRFLDRCIGADHDWTSALTRYDRNPPFLKSFLENRDLERSSRSTIISGESFFRKAIIDYFSRQKISCQEENIIIDNSVFLILKQIYKILGLEQNKQKVLLPIPTFGYYYMQCHESGIQNELLQTYKDDGWKIRPERLYKTLKDNPNIGMVLLNYPSNPTGIVMTESYGKSLAEVFKLFPNLYIVSDEVLRDIVLDPKIKPFSIGSIAELSSRVITLNGISKSRSGDDFRVSFACAPSQIVDEYDYSHHIGGISLFMHGVAAQSLIDNQENQDYLLNNIKIYKENIDNINFIIDKINKNLSKHFNDEDSIYIKPYIKNPEAGNVYLLDFSGLKEKIFADGRKLRTGLEVASFLLENSGVAMVPGEYFFIHGSEMVLRLSSSITIKEIEKGFEKISEAIISNLISPPKTAIAENKVIRILPEEIAREK